MKKIIFGITSLTLGGAEKVLVDLANKLSEKYEITIFTIYSKGEFEKNLNNKIKLKTIYNFQFKDMGKIKKQLIPLKLLLFKKHYYKKYIKGNYDIEIAFLEGPITRLFSIKNKKARKIAWVHNDITKVYGKNIKAKIKMFLDKKIYEKYRTIIFVSKDNRDKFVEKYKDLRDKNLQPIQKRVIYNYINIENIEKKAEEIINLKFDNKNINFLTVARLVSQKGIDRLINIHSKLIKQGMEHKFYIIGDGPEKEKLEQQIKELNIQGTFILLGKKENPYPYIKSADIFCLLSRFEGYGMVLEEAKILGKPVLITDTAAREAVEKYKNSKIVKNTEEGIYVELKDIIKKNIRCFNNMEDEKYDNSKIIKKLEKLLDE